MLREHAYVQMKRLIALDKVIPTVALMHAPIEPDHYYTCLLSFHSCLFSFHMSEDYNELFLGIVDEVLRNRE